MDFSDEIRQFAKKIESFKESITTEEATKTSVIMPFFSILGYDIFNPNEFIPEFVADVGIKKGEKVDYAILQDGEPVIIIEAKAINRNLEKHDSQLFRYFATTKAKFAILTNGIRYRFFTDLDNPNKMDSLPFLEFNILSIRENQIDALKKFQKSNFNVAKIFDSASILKYQGKFKETLAEQFENPNDDFIRLFLQDVYPGMKTQSVLDKFRPILKASMQEFISDTMNDKIKIALNPTASAEQESASLKTSDNNSSDVLEEESPLEATENEINAYYHLKNLFKNYINLEDITYKKTESYFAVLYKNNSRKWICRLILSNTQNILILPDQDKHEVRCNISNILELGNYGRYMISVLARYATLLQSLEVENPSMYQIIVKRRVEKPIK